MSSPFLNIALMGRQRTGKDTIAAHLRARFAYACVAFADPLREMALEVDPLVPLNNLPGNAYLSDVVASNGWEDAKERYPEVRRILQRLGAAVREFDEDFWLNIAARKISGAAGWGIPVVVTDVRYPNEYDALRRAGFRMVRVERPGVGSNDQHESESFVDGFTADVTVVNDGTLYDLRDKAEALAQR